MLGGPAACHRLLLLHATTAGQVSQLHHLGLMLGVELWAQDFRDRPMQLQREAQRKLQQEEKERQQQQGGGQQGKGEGQQEGFSTVDMQGNDGEALSGEGALAVAMTAGAEGRRHSPLCAPEGEEGQQPAACVASQGGLPVVAADPGECLALIEAIRREEFGLGGDEDALGEAGRKLREVGGWGRPIAG